MRLALFLMFGLALVFDLALFGAEGAYSKTAYETRDLIFDFTPAAANGVTLVQVKAVNVTTFRDDTASIISQSPPPQVLPGTSKVQFRVQGGSSGTRESILIDVTNKQTGEQLEGIVALSIVSAQ